MLSATTHAAGSSPYWYKLIGGKLGSVTVEELVTRLKTTPSMPPWQKFQLSLVVIVEGILLCRTQPVKPSVEIVEMVKTVDFFLAYPWGRHAFTRTINMIKVGRHISDISTLVKKLQQSSMAVHSFPLAIQLHAFNSIPLLLTLLPHSDSNSSFRDSLLTTLPKIKSYHTSNILQIEYDPQVFPPFSVHPYFKLLSPDHLFYCLSVSSAPSYTP